MLLEHRKDFQEEMENATYAGSHLGDSWPPALDAVSFRPPRPLPRRGRA